MKGKELTLTVTNPDLTKMCETAIAIRSASLKTVRATTLTSEDIHAYNSFDNPRRIEPKEGQVTPKSGALVFNFALASVTRLHITLA